LDKRDILFCDQASSNDENLIHLFLAKDGEVFHFLGHDIPKVCGVSTVTLNSPTSDVEANKLNLFDGVKPISFAIKDGSWHQIGTSREQLSSIGVFGLAQTKHADKVDSFRRQAQSIALSLL
jgi:hypothetical protein